MRLHLRAKVSEVPVMAKQSAQAIIAGSLKVFEGRIFDRNSPDALDLQGWAMENYHMVGFGTSRDVFAIDENYVLKVATCAAGLAQNRVEEHVSSKWVDLPLARVEYAAKNDLFLVVDRAQALNEQHFLETYGETFDVFCDLVDSLYEATPNQRRSIYQSMTPQLRHFVVTMQKRGIPVWDLDREEQWGDFRDEPVVIDYGLNPHSVQEY